MKSPLVIASLAALGLLLGGVSATEPARVNGWYPCAFSTPQGDTPKNLTALHDLAVFECSEIEVPLCYDGVCDSDRKINVFVKRRQGTMESKDPSVPRKAAILVQGGPGMSSIVMESSFFSYGNPDDDSIDFYTFDHRGTGRSEFLQCDAAAALTPGGPEGVHPSPDELPTCLEDLDFQYNGQAAAFSATSAAMDVRMIIDTFLANHHVYIGGVSYGTYLAQRILQLKIPQVQGYIFDGVDVLSTKDDPVEGANSHWNQALKAPARRLLEFCFDDPKCPLKLKTRETALEDALEILDKLDAEPNECAKVIATSQQKEVPSEALRAVLFEKVKEFKDRTMGLAIFGAVQRCNDEDLTAINGLYAPPSEGSSSEAPAGPETPAPLDPLTGSSDLLYEVIVLNERWAQPPPTSEEHAKFFRETPFAMDLTSLSEAYCVFTGSTEPACQELQDKLPASNATFAYKHDKYYDEPITLPDYASALVINGGLDFQTPKEFGELLYSKLQGSGKGVMMVEFDYGTHCLGEVVPEAPTTSCHDSIIHQFIASGGDVNAIDTNCMAELAETTFHLEEPSA